MYATGHAFAYLGRTETVERRCGIDINRRMVSAKRQFRAKHGLLRTKDVQFQYTQETSSEPV